MKKTKLLVALFCVASLFVGCNQDDSGPGNDGPSDSDFEQNFGATASRDFIGQVVDLNNQPVQSATVKIGSLSVQTDGNGVFVINGASVYEKFAYITVTKTGYFEGSRAMVPTSGKNNVKIMLIPNAPVATVASGQSSEVTTESGTKLIFDGSFEDENGAAYSGNVSVSIYHLTTSNPDLGQLMPGMLYAERENGDEAALETFGMINVELRGSGGQKLQPAQGHAATIEVAIDASQMATAPASIPLWHFDAAKGWWKEDGIATRQGDKYVGEASHFSWWNCDAPFPTVQLNLTVTDSNGNPLSNVLVTLGFGIGYTSTTGFTDQNGHVSGLIPSNQTLDLNVYDSCGNIAYGTSIGPFTADTTLAIATSASALSTTVQGMLLSCDGNPVQNGYVFMQAGGTLQFTSVENGIFSFNTFVCSPSLTVTVIGADYDSLQETDSITYTLQTPVTNIGNLQACNAVDEFISYQVDDDPTVFIIQNVNASFGSEGQVTGLTISGYNQQTPTNPNGAGLYIYSQSVTTAGVYTTAQFSLEGTLGYVWSGSVNDIVFNVTSVGNVGQYVDMNFSGTFVGDDGQTHTLTGVAHAIRDF